jgi:hypothetical protein
MAKLTLTDLASLENDDTAIAAINANNAAIETALENTLSRDGTTPNTMSASLDMNGQTIVNLPTPITDTEPATKGYVDDIAGLEDSAAITAAVAASAASAAAAAASAVTSAAHAATLRATSTSSHTPSVASKAFTLVETTDRQMPVGSWVLIRSDANPTTVWMFGQVTAYDTGTEVLTVDVQVIGTATLAADWTITVAGIRGATGATGAAGADYTADAELAALAALTATPGLLAQTADNVFTTRTVTGTADLITVTDGDGVAGNPTITVGSNVVRKDVTGVLAVGHTHTVYDHGLKSGTATVTPLPSLGYLQKCTLAAASNITIEAPTAEEGYCILQITNTGAPTSVTFNGFDKTFTGVVYTLTIDYVHWVFIYSIGTLQAMQLQLVDT